MKNEDQNIAVAKFNGYKIESGKEHNCRYKITDTGGGVCFCDYLEGYIPDYGKDLNAMNRVLSTMSNAQGIDLCWHLNDMGISGDWELVNVSASNLREALLRKLNLWTEE